MIPDSITIFTDGSSRGNPGPGGFAAVIVHGEKVTEVGGREEHTTNNRMELMAAIKALQQIQDVRAKIKMFTDSSYLVNGITKWVFSWERRNWVTMDKQPVLNKDLWEKLLELITIYRNCEWKLIGGHVGVAGNMRCDEIATAFADNLPPVLYYGPLSGYPVRNILDISENALLSEKKDAGKTRSNAKAYSYVSLVDGKIQTHKTWAECEARVKGKQARYKKALSREEESSIISDFSTKK